MSAPIPSDIAVCIDYDDGLFLTPALMTLEQKFFLNWNALQNRMLYTAGVLEGLTVARDGDFLRVASGAGFDAVTTSDEETKAKREREQREYEREQRRCEQRQRQGKDC